MKINSKKGKKVKSITFSIYIFVYAIHYINIEVYRAKAILDFFSYPTPLSPASDGGKFWLVLAWSFSRHASCLMMTPYHEANKVNGIIRLQYSPARKWHSTLRLG